VSNINHLGINENFPVAGQDNDTQVFRDNFDTIKTGLRIARDEITALEDTTAKLTQDNDFELNVIQNAVLQNNRTQKSDIGIVPLETASDNTITVDFKNGDYQIYRFRDDVVLDFLNFPGDNRITPFENSEVGMGKVTLEIYGDGGSLINSGSFVINQIYTIESLGTAGTTTDFTLIGASSNTVGTVFKATGSGTGNGTARVHRNITFSLSGSGASTIKKNNNFPTDLAVISNTDPVFVEVWRHNTTTFFMRYLGQFS